MDLLFGYKPMMLKLVTNGLSDLTLWSNIGQCAVTMMQQSFGVSNDYLAQLTDDNPQGIQIPRDGKVCRPNPWPNPVR